MIKEITIYFRPVNMTVVVDDNLDEDDIEQEINRQIYDKQIDNITNNAIIDYWEE